MIAACLPACLLELSHKMLAVKQEPDYTFPDMKASSISCTENMQPFIDKAKLLLKQYHNQMEDWGKRSNNQLRLGRKDPQVPKIRQSALRCLRKAQTISSQLLCSNPTDPQSYLLAAKIYLSVKDVRSAVKVYENGRKNIKKHADKSSQTLNENSKVLHQLLNKYKSKLQSAASKAHKVSVDLKEFGLIPFYEVDLNARDPTLYLPSEILTRIFRHLDSSSVKSSILVNKRWMSVLCANKQVWSDLRLKPQPIYLDAASISSTSSTSSTNSGTMPKIHHLDQFLRNRVSIGGLECLSIDVRQVQKFYSQYTFDQDNEAGKSCKNGLTLILKCIIKRLFQKLRDESASLPHDLKFDTRLWKLTLITTKFSVNIDTFLVTLPKKRLIYPWIFDNLKILELFCPRISMQHSLGALLFECKKLKSLKILGGSILGSEKYKHFPVLDFNEILRGLLDQSKRTLEPPSKKLKSDGELNHLNHVVNSISLPNLESIHFSGFHLHEEKHFLNFILMFQSSLNDLSLIRCCLFPKHPINERDGSRLDVLLLLSRKLCLKKLEWDGFIENNSTGTNLVFQTQTSQREPILSSREHLSEHGNTEPASTSSSTIIPDLNLQTANADDCLIEICRQSRNNLQELIARNWLDNTLSDFGLLFQCNFAMGQRISSNLRKVDFKDCHGIDDRALTALAENCSTSLTHVTISTCISVTSSGLKILFNSASRLQYIQLEQLPMITDEAIFSLADSPSRKNLHVIELRVCEGIGNSGITSLHRILSKIDIESHQRKTYKLQRVNIVSCNSIERDRVEKLIKIFDNNVKFQISYSLQ